MSNGYPNTKQKMRRAGYSLIQIRPCKLCRVNIELWRTTHGKEIAFDTVNGDYTVMPSHRTTCKVLLQQQASRNVQSDPMQRFAAQMRAAAVIVVDSGGYAHWFLEDLCTADPADMHITLTNTADAVRDELVRRFSQEAA